MRNFKSGIAVAALIAGCLGGTVQAQDRDVATAAATEDVGDEIVVTAQRRAAPAQDAPLTVQVIGGAELQQKGITNLDQIVTLTSGVKIDNNGGRGYTYIRGIGTDSVGIGVDPSVATYIDGVYSPRGNSVTAGLWDIDHVEVLKGPQGTLYGRNATGGVLLTVTKQAKLGETSGYAFGSYGNLDRKRVEAAVNVPLGDTVAVRVSGLYLDDDGYMHNLLKNRTEGGQTVKGLRGNFLFSPSDAFSATVSGYYMKVTGSRGATFKLLASQPSPTLRTFPTVTIPTDKYDVNYDGDNAAELEMHGASLTLQGAVGPVAVKSVSAYTYTAANRKLDFDATEIRFNHTIGGLETSKAYSQSLQFNNTTPGALSWIAGADYIHEDLAADIRQFIYPSTNRQLISANNVDAISAFVDLNYEVLPGLHLLGGARYSVEDKKFFFVRRNDGSFEQLTPKIGLQYEITSHAMVYATATKGFKSGGFNSSAVQPPFGPEKIWSYEAGVKTSWWQNRLVANLSVFHYDYKDLQVTQIDGVTGVPITTNAGSANVNGVDGELSLRVTPAFRVGGNFTVLDTSFGNLSLQNVALTGSPYVNVSGNQFSRAPKFSAALDAAYTVELAASKVTLSGDMRYSTRVYFTPFETSYVSQPHYAVANARLAWSNDRLEIAGFVNNLTDKFYVSTVQTFPGNIGTSYLPAEPRTYGASVRVNF